MDFVSLGSVLVPLGRKLVELRSRGLSGLRVFSFGAPTPILFSRSRIVGDASCIARRSISAVAESRCIVDAPPIAESSCTEDLTLWPKVSYNFPDWLLKDDDLVPRLFHHAEFRFRNVANAAGRRQLHFLRAQEM